MVWSLTGLLCSLSRANVVYEDMKQRYGPQGCALLKTNTRPSSADSGEQIPDPWGQYLQPSPLSSQVRSHIPPDGVQLDSCTAQEAPNHFGCCALVLLPRRPFCRTLLRTWLPVLLRTVWVELWRTVLTLRPVSALVRHTGISQKPASQKPVRETSQSETSQSETMNWDLVWARWRPAVVT